MTRGADVFLQSTNLNQEVRDSENDSYFDCAALAAIAQPFFHFRCVCRSSSTSARSRGRPTDSLLRIRFSRETNGKS